MTPDTEQEPQTDEDQQYQEDKASYWERQRALMKEEKRA